MNEWLAQMYNTHGAGEEQEKLAQVDLFCKLAAENNIDLSQLSQSEVNALYAQVFPKTASDDGDEDDEEKDENGFPKKKKNGEESAEEKAASYHREKVAFQEKFAEADLMGRVMAHSFTQELNEIQKKADYVRPMERAALKERGITSQSRRASKATQTGKTRWLKGAPSYEGASGAIDKSHMGAIAKGKSLLRRAGKAVSGLPGPAKAALLAGGGVAAGVGAAKALSGDKKKAASAAAFEELAANHAIKVAAAAGYDEDQAYELVSAIYTLGLEETEKVAYVQDTDDAIHIRALEYLEAAEYPVNWDEVFGG